MADLIKTFDVAQYKQAVHDQWNEDAAGWSRWTPTMQKWLNGPTELMLELAQLKPGYRILDLASGAGEPALTVAARIGPRGNVLATDLSENILLHAQRAASERGLHNFDTQVMDGENLFLPDNSFDVVMCRLGLMLMPDRAQALKEWRRVLRPGGRLVVMVFSTPGRNPWAAVPISIIRKRTKVSSPAPGQPGIFSLGADGALEDYLSKAGFNEIETYPISAPLRLTSAKEAVQLTREAFGGVKQLMSHLPSQEQEAIWKEVEEALQVYESQNGYEAPSEPIVGVGVKQ